MAVKIRLKRIGKKRAPFYRIVVMDARTKRDGRAIEEIGKYNPKAEPSFIHVESDRAQYWLGVGAQPTEAVVAIFKASGDWQQFKGEAAPAPLRVKEPKRDKLEIFNEALSEAHGSSKSDAVTKKAAAKKTDKKADDKKADDAKAGKKADDAKAPAEAAKVAEAPAAADAAGDEKAAKYGADAAAPTADGSAPEGFTIKGNEDSMKYHTTESPWYEKTVAEVWFRTEEAATKAGFTAAGAAADAADKA